MSRNSFDEGDDKIMPLGGQFTVSKEGAHALRTGEHASARRKNSISRFGRSRSVKETSSSSSSSSSGSGGGLSHSKSTKDNAPFRANTLSNNGFAPSRSKSLRAPPPPNLRLKREMSKKGGSTFIEEDFHSPSVAPAGQRIFDAQAIAAAEGQEIVDGGWATDKKTQEKLDAERKKLEQEERENQYTGENGDLKHNGGERNRSRSKSFKDFFTRSPRRS